MKKENSEILNRLGKDSGFKVPENYFAEFNKRMAESLPEITITEVESKPTLWLRVRPFVYMAAMFMGVFLMMKVFDGLSGKNSSNHDLTAGLVDERNVEDLMYTGCASESDFMYSEEFQYYDEYSEDGEVAEEDEEAEESEADVMVEE